MADANSGIGGRMDLNVYLHFHSLPQLGSHGEPVFATLEGDYYTGRENSEDLPQNAEATSPVPVEQHWREMNGRARVPASNSANIGSDSVNGGAEYRGIDSQDADLVLTDPVDPREESENAPSHIDKSNERPKLQLELTEDELNNSSANFECNICFEIAKQPVVTSCGHLFCWRCLYQWLYIHSCTKKCPVCKGLVTDSNIIPIYGRGGANDSGCERKDDVKSSSDLKLPPRPHGVRIESMRQRMRSSRAMNNGSLNEMPSRIHNEGGVDYGQAIHQVVRRLRLRSGNFAQEWLPGRGPRRRLTNTESTQGQEPRRQSTNTENIQGQDSDGGSRLSSFVRERVDFWQQISRSHLPGYDGLSSLGANRANVERIVSRLARERSSNSLLGSSTNHVNLEQPPNLETHANGSANRPGSVDSVIAVIEGNGPGDNQSELNSTANSLASNGLRSAASGSSDMHGDVSCGRKMRRLN